MVPAIDRRRFAIDARVDFGGLPPLAQIVTSPAGYRIARLYLEPVIVARPDTAAAGVEYFERERHIGRHLDHDRAVGFYRRVTDDFAHAETALQPKRVVVEIRIPPGRRPAEFRPP